MSGYKILHKKSIQGTPQISAITYGELAVRYGENNEAILLKNNNDKIVSIDAHPKISENYESITYPQSSNVIFESVISGQTIESAVSIVENNVLKLIDETIKNEEVIASAISNISDAVGLDSNLSYLTNDSANYISGATSLTDADNKLDAALKDLNDDAKNVTLQVSDILNVLQEEIGLNENKEYIPYVEGAYISSASTIYEANVLLDKGLNNLNHRFNTLLSADTSEAIDNYQEIIKFLQDVKETDELKNILEQYNIDISNISGNTDNNSLQISTLFNIFLNEVGFNRNEENNIIFTTNDSANYISGATSLTDANDKLDAAIFNVSERLKNLEDENNDYITENDLNNALSDYVTLDDIKTYNGSTNIFIDETNNQISVKHDSSLNDGADGLQVNLNENGGLSLDNNGIYIKCSSGLTNNTNGININLGEGIKFDVNSALTLNLKTINNQSLLGNGNITITGSSSSDGSYDDSEIRQNINTIGESIGLKSDFTYNPNISANYISGATSVAEATNILDNKIKNLLKVEGTTLTLNL